jgi:hypothetical protein
MLVTGNTSSDPSNYYVLSIASLYNIQCICFINWLPNVGTEHYYTVVTLDQGHLHPLQEHLRQTGVGQESNPSRLLRRRAL